MKILQIYCSFIYGAICKKKGVHGIGVMVCDDKAQLFGAMAVPYVGLW